LKNMKSIQYILTYLLLIGLLPGLSFAEIRNEREVGLLLGDPIAVSLKIPVKENTFLNLRAGAWSWHFWNGDIDYNTPYISLDYAWLFSYKQTQRRYYAGAGMAVFFADNPKDKNNYEAAAAIRFPLGVEIYKKENLTLGFELAPIYQFAPAYDSGPYGLELNGGFTFGLSF